MKIFKKIMICLLVIFLSFSIVLNIILNVSNTLGLAFKDNVDLRERIYYKTYYSFMDETNKEGLTFHSINTNDSLDYYLDEVIHCVYDGLIPSKCEMVSYMYNKSDDTLIKTTYLPGDGYKYVVEGETKSKVLSSNASLLSYGYSMIYGLYLNSYVLSYETSESSGIVAEFDTKIKFNFEEFGLFKHISSSVTKGNQTLNYAFVVDNKDRVVSIQIGESQKLTCDYEGEELAMPSFEGYVLG